jgi:serine/threonine protein kinase
MSTLIQPGAMLQNRYRVIEQIGHGGMGAVYVATDERFRSAVAIKQTLFDDPALSKAFEREAHLLNHLRHAALPKVSDHFVEAAGQFLVMEYIEGYDFAELLRQRNGAFPLAEVLAWADQLLDALEYLHSREPAVVHRDIKPQNVKWTPRGQIVLLDFGLAKGLPAQPSANASNVFGYTRNYAPLEQIQGMGADPRSDLYSLGATLYHLLTGMAPVDALARAAALAHHQPDPLRPAHLAHAQVPTEVGERLCRAMAQNPAHRPRTAAELRADLRRAANNIGAHHPFRALETMARAQKEHPAFRDTIVSASLLPLDSPSSTAGAPRIAARPTSAQSQPEALMGDTNIVEPTRCL